MKSAGSLTAVLAIVGSTAAQIVYEEKLHVGPPPASLSTFFASPSTTSVPLPTAPVLTGIPTSSAAASAPGTALPSTGGNCITFTADDPSWSYSNSGPWTGSGTFGDLPGGKLCLPSNAAGGAMYIGTSAKPSAGNTKLECYFPLDPSQPSNCDVSLVDGYSLSVTCTMEGASQPQIGGSVNLWTSGTCPGGQKGGVCPNTKAYDAAQSDVDPFFQTGINAPNNYCIWWACTQDSFFKTGTEIKCHVSAGTPAASKRDVGETVETREAKLHRRSHVKSLRQVVSA